MTVDNKLSDEETERIRPSDIAQADARIDEQSKIADMFNDAITDIRQQN